MKQILRFGSGAGEPLMEYPHIRGVRPGEENSKTYIYDTKEFELDSIWLKSEDGGSIPVDQGNIDVHHPFYVNGIEYTSRYDQGNIFSKESYTLLKIGEECKVFNQDKLALRFKLTDKDVTIENTAYGYNTKLIDVLEVNSYIMAGNLSYRFGGISQSRPSYCQIPTDGTLIRVYLYLIYNV